MRKSKCLLERSAGRPTGVGEFLNALSDRSGHGQRLISYRNIRALPIVRRRK